MKRDLVDGYLYEVTKSLPRKERKEVYENLELEIYEKIELRKADNIETKEEVLSVLEEYGNPADVAARYSSSNKRALVPQPHFAHYSRDKFLAFFIAILVIGGLHLYNYFFVGTFPITLDFILGTLASLGTAFVVIYITYTLAFSWISGSRLPNWNRYAKGIKPEPTKASRVSFFEVGFQVVLSTLLFVVLGLGREILGIELNEFNIVPNFALPVFAALVIAYFINVLNIAYKEIDKKYTLGVLFTTVLTNLLVIGIAFLMFVREDVISQNFRNWLAGLLPDSDLIYNIVNNFGLVVFLIIALFAVIDIVSTALGYHNNKKDSVEPIFREERIYADVDEIYETSDGFKDDSYHNITDTPIDTIDEEVVLDEDLDKNVHIADDRYAEDRTIDDKYVGDTVVDDRYVDEEYVEDVKVNNRYTSDRQIDEDIENTVILDKEEFVSTESPDYVNKGYVEDEVVIVDEPVYTEEDLIVEEDPVIVDSDSTIIEDEDDEYITRILDKEELDKELNRKNDEVIVVEETTEKDKLN